MQKRDFQTGQRLLTEHNLPADIHFIPISFILSREWFFHLRPAQQQHLIEQLSAIYQIKLDDNHIRSLFTEKAIQQKIKNYFTQIQTSSNRNKKRIQEVPELLQDVLDFIDIAQNIRFYDEKAVDLIKKKMGSYYTPTGVIQFLIKEIADLFWPNASKEGLKENQIISDYACGMGQFLFLTALEFFNNSSAPQKKSKKRPKFQFLGIDSDPFAIKIADFCIKLLEIDPDLSIHFQNFKFILTDSLSPLPHTFKNQLNSRNSAKIIPDFNEEIVTLLLSNPPYQSWGLGRVEKLQKTKDAEYRKNFPNTAEYKISLYSLFIERAIQLLKTNGITGLILPDSFLTGKYFRKLREFLLKCTSIHEIVFFQKNFWADADSGLPVILILQKNELNTNDEHHQLSSMTKIRTIKADFVGNKVKIINDYQVYQDTFWFAPQFRFRLFFNPEDEAFVLHFELNSKPLGEFFEVHHGIRSKTGIGKRRIVSHAHKGLFWKPSLITGNSITPYHVHYQGHFIYTHPDLLFSGGFDPTKVEQEKIILRRTGDRLIAAVDDDHLYHTNTLLYLIPKPGTTSPLSLHALCAILNSNSFNRYYRLISLKENRTLPQVEVDMVLNLPLKFDTDLLSELEEASRVLHGLRGAQKIHPIQGEDRKDVDEIYALIDDCVELLYLKDEFDHLLSSEKK